MNLARYLMQSRGPVNAARRLGVIAQRFGISQDKMGAALDAYLDVTDRFGCTPTLAITANLLDRYPRPFIKLAERGAELAVHGYVHTNYGQLGLEQQAEHMDKALSAYRRLGIPVAGSRGPYLGWNAESIAVAKAAGLSYTSNTPLAWDVTEREDVPAQSWAAYDKGLALYGARKAVTTASLPTGLDGGLLDLPVSLPDDEEMVDRLGLTPGQRKAAWLRILDRVYARGELFTLILHHERLLICRDELEFLLSEARTREPKVWIAPLKEISSWWRRRSGYRLEIKPLDDGLYEVTGPSDDEVTVLVHAAAGASGSRPWFGQYRLGPERFTVQSGPLPAIGVREDAPEQLVRFLEAEGYVVQRGDKSRCALFLDRTAFCEDDKLAIAEAIENSAAPLVRLWRWPGAARCALAITGDVDAMSLIDFLRRPLEV